MTIGRYLSSLLVKQSGAFLAAGELLSTGQRTSLRIASVLVHQHQQPKIFTNHRATLYTTTARCDSALAKLRKKTGYAFALCRKALELHDQDIAKAEKWLRAEAMKQGWEKAQRVKSRSTGEGLVGIYTTPDRTTAAMVEVKCETDFVARNEHFISLVTKLAERLSGQSSAALDRRETGSCINKLWIVDEKKLNEIAGDTITETISKLGENIRFVRGCLLRIQTESGSGGDSSAVHLLPYTHAVAGKVASTDPNVILGKYGTIIAIQKRAPTPVTADTATESTADDEDLAVTASSSIEEVGSKLGQHIIGLTPLTVAPTEADLTAADAAADNVQGDEEPTALLKQKFIFNEDITVEQFLGNSGATVLDFVRFECGEEMETD